MCDQLSTIGLEFNVSRMESTFTSDLRFSAAHPFPFAPAGSGILPRPIGNLFKASKPLPWATEEVFHPPSSGPSKRDSAECDRKDKHPEGNTKKLWQNARPWGLGMIRAPTSLTVLAGKSVRRPGLFMRVDEDTNEDTTEPLMHTNETIHSCVRVRLACRGLGLDDKEVWTCDSLKGPDGKPLWVLEKGSGFSEAEEKAIREFQPREPQIAPDEYQTSLMYPSTRDDTAWRWRYVGTVRGEGDAQVPHSKIMPEEPLVGYWERFLLGMIVNEPDVWKYAQRGVPSSST